MSNFGNAQFDKLSHASERPILSGAGMKLKDLLAGAGVQSLLPNRWTQEISSVAYDSRQRVARIAVRRHPRRRAPTATVCSRRDRARRGGRRQ